MSVTIIIKLAQLSQLTADTLAKLVTTTCSVHELQCNYRHQAEYSKKAEKGGVCVCKSRRHSKACCRYVLTTQINTQRPNWRSDESNDDDAKERFKWRVGQLSFLHFDNDIAARQAVRQAGSQAASKPASEQANERVSERMSTVHTRC